MKMRYRSSLVLAVLQLHAAEAAQEASGFPTTQPDDCARVFSVDNSPSNTYETNTVTTWTKENFTGSPDGRYFDLKFNRLNATQANGGRCNGPSSGAISGDGTFSTRIYIHTAVRGSDGVFTVAMMTKSFSQETELDLFVANLPGADGTRLVKFGNPHYSDGIPLQSIEGKWVTVAMIRRGEVCDLSLKDDNGGILYHNAALQCRMGPQNVCGQKYSDPCGPNLIVMNSRSLDYTSSSAVPGRSFVSIANVKWQPDEAFGMSLTDLSGAKTRLSCLQSLGETQNYYGSLVQRDVAGNWQSPDDGAPWRLTYEKPQGFSGDRGRCETANSPLLTGNGELTGQIEIEPGVLSSNGSFGVSLVPTPYSYDQSVFLFNLAGNRVVFGNPQNASVTLGSSWVGKKLKIVLKKTGPASCSLSVKDPQGTVLHSGSVTCASGSSNKLVISSRAVNTDAGNGSGVLISNVSWSQSP